MIKTCWICKHLSFYEGKPAYSEVTPGSDASVHCDSGVRMFSFYHDDVKREAIKLAAKCAFYEPEDQST